MVCHHRRGISGQIVPCMLTIYIITLHKDENVIPNASKLLDRICAMYNVDFEGGELSSA